MCSCAQEAQQVLGRKSCKKQPQSLSLYIQALSFLPGDVAGLILLAEG